MRVLPRIVNQICMLHDAWIVGRNMNPVRDYDVIVAFFNWKEVAVLIPIDANPNSFGGWKFTDEGKSVDV